MRYASANRPRFQPARGEAITLYLSSGERVSAVVTRRRVRITRSHLASHPVYCTLTLLTRAALTRLLTADKPHAGRLVVGWVTTSESLLLYVLIFFFF
jgi:hypothetical protein